MSDLKTHHRRFSHRNSIKRARPLSTSLAFVLNSRTIFQHALLALFLFFVASSLASEDAPEKVTISLPEGQSISFRAVFLGIDGTQMFNSRRITLGSRESDTSYKSQLTETLLSGGFVGNRDGEVDWLFYMGETEIQERQWSSVMRWLDERNNLPQRRKTDSKFPKTEISVAEVYQFIEALNTWMLTHEREYLPSFQGALAFCRLPTETEWAFSARGGMEAFDSGPDVFDRPHPYGEDLGDHEWHRSNSGNEVQECASPNLKPNPLGLFDMLGNVEELTMSLFGPEYQQGRFGYYVIRGGNFSTNPSDISAALRTEAYSHGVGGEVARPPKVGFRLVLSTRISSVRATPDELDAEFDRYAANIGLTRPGRVGESSPAGQADQDKLYFLENQLDRLRSEKEILATTLANLEQTKQSEKERAFAAVRNAPALEAQLARKDQTITDLQRRIALFDHELSKNAGRVRDVEKRYLEALMRQASANAYLAWRTLAKLALLPDDRRSDVLYKRRWEEASQMVRDYWALVVQIAEQTQPSLFPEVKSDLAGWMRAREQKGAAGRQRKSLDLLERHVSDVRSGIFHRPEDLAKSFTEEPELK